MRPHATDGRYAVHDLCPTGLVLDLGAGTGSHTGFFEGAGHKVWPVDAHPQFDDCLQWFFPVDPTTDALFEIEFDIVWAAHVLEHSTNPGSFLTHCRWMLKPGGYLAVTVPPMKPEIVGGHVTVWNAGLLLYNLILAGFDCSQASVKTYDYNITVIVPRSSIVEEVAMRRHLDTLSHDHGDIEKLREYFPLPVSQGFNGVIEEVNWP